MKNNSKFLGNELNYIKKVLDSEMWNATEGSWTSNLENAFAEKFESKYAVAFNSGTSTLHAALLALGVSPGDEVISPALTVIMNTAVTIHCGAIPVYVDIDPDTFNICPKDLRKKITSKTKAIQIVSVYGQSPEMDEIMEIANEFNIPVIEDNAECFLGYYKDKLVGTFGKISSYSFENSKHISCGEGGIITSSDEHLAERCRKFGGHGFKSLTAQSGRIKLDQSVFQNPNYKRHDEIGYNYRLSEFSSAIALAQLERIDELVSLRVQSANIFMDVMKDCEFLVPQYTPDYIKNSYWALGVKYYGDDILGVSWYDFRKKYMEFGGDGIYGAWSVPYLEPSIQNRSYVKFNPNVYEDVHYNQGLCPNAEEVQKKLMVFKTNYRNIDLAKDKSQILAKTIKYFTK
jgi:perosamine synthetase